MDELFIKKNGEEEKSLGQLIKGATLLNVSVGGPQINPMYFSMAGSDGSRLENVTFQPSTITTDILLVGIDRLDFELVKDRLYGVFYSRDLIRIRSSIEPAKAAYVLPKPVDITPFDMQSSGTVALQFENPMGYRISPFKSDELRTHGDELQFGMGLEADKVWDYHFNSKAFNVFNAGQLRVDPYVQHHSLTIKLKGIGQNFTIKNVTNGSTIQVNQPLNGGDEFILDGITPSINGNQNINYDFGNIDLDVGDNEIEITGLDNVDCLFSFPFLYY